jgi:hypothetical protein
MTFAQIFLRMVIAPVLRKGKLLFNFICSKPASHLWMARRLGLSA